jgi:hypothetical protein
MKPINLFSALGAFVVAASLISPVYAGKGAGSGGGGQAVIYQDGAVRFLDLVAIAELPSEAVSSTDVVNRFFKPERYVKKLAQIDTEFFQCSLDKFSKHKDMVVLNRLEDMLPRLQVLQVEFRIPNVAEEAREELNVPLAAAPSPSAPASLQGRKFFSS